VGGLVARRHTSWKLRAMRKEDPRRECVAVESCAGDVRTGPAEGKTNSVHDFGFSHMTPPHCVRELAYPMAVRLLGPDPRVSKKPPAGIDKTRGRRVNFF
jgi:hypothetical protein